MQRITIFVRQLSFRKFIQKNLIQDVEEKISSKIYLTIYDFYLCFIFAMDLHFVDVKLLFLIKTQSLFYSNFFKENHMLCQ